MALVFHDGFLTGGADAWASVTGSPTFTHVDDYTAVSALAATEGIAQAATFSADGVYLAVAHRTSPQITVYKRRVTRLLKLMLLML